MLFTKAFSTIWLELIEAGAAGVEAEFNQALFEEMKKEFVEEVSNGKRVVMKEAELGSKKTKLAVQKGERKIGAMVSEGLQKLRKAEACDPTACDPKACDPEACDPPALCVRPVAASHRDPPSDPDD